MIDLAIDTDDLLKWSRFASEMPARTPRAIARALNTFGKNVEAAMIDYLSASTGLDQEQVRSVTTIEEASSGSLHWSMDASRALLTDADEWRRPWTERPSDSEFEEQILLNIVSQPECCEICAEAAENGPYTAAEISNMAAVWANYEPPAAALANAPVTNLLHPNCHCGTTAWEQTQRRIPVSFSGGDEQLLTVEEIGRELGKVVLDELEGEIRTVLTG